MGEREGIATALQLAGAGPGQPEAEDLADLFGDIVAPAVQAPGQPGPQGGRPRGSRNKSTEQWRQYLLSKYPSPLETLLALTTRKPEDLARELGLWKYNEGEPIALATGEAAAIIVKAAEAALPYLHQKQPLAVETKGDGLAGLGVLVMGEFGGSGDAQTGFGIDARPIEQNQGVIDVTPEKSDVEKVGQAEKRNDP